MLNGLEQKSALTIYKEKTVLMKNINKAENIYLVGSKLTWVESMVFLEKCHLKKER